MEKKNEVKKGMKVNVKYVDFLDKLRKEKIEIGSGNKEKIGREYREIVGLKESNIKRVVGRNGREEVKGVLKIVLNNKKMNLEEYEKLSEKVIEIIG